MSKKSNELILLLLFVTFNIQAQTIYQISASKIEFSSNAPLELIEASCKTLQGAMKIDDRTFAFRAPMAQFEGFNSALQKTHFNANYLETEKYEFTIFEGKIIEDIDFNTPGTYKVRGKGRLTCHGIVQERIIKCKIVVKPGSVKISSEFTVMLDDHDIKIPSVVHQRIAEEITVLLDIEMKKK